MRKINVVIIGGSYKSTIGSTHINSILLSNKYNIEGYFFSRNRNINLRTANNYNLNKDKLYFDINDLLKDNLKNIDAVIVLVPPMEKLNVFKQICKYNIKNIISEKPLCSAFKDVIKINKLFKKKKIKIYTTFNYLGYPAIIQMKNMLNKIGSLKLIDIQMPQETFLKQNLSLANWRKTDGEIPVLLLDLASHCLSFIYYFYKTNTLDYFAHSVVNRKLNASESFDIILKNKNFYSKIFVSKSNFGERNNLSIRIYGTKGSLKWYHDNPESILFSNKKNFNTMIKRSEYINKIKNNPDLFTYKDGHPNGFIEAFSNIYKEIFYRIIKNNKNRYRPFLFNLSENIKIMKDLKKISHSSKSKKWIK